MSEDYRDFKAYIIEGNSPIRRIGKVTKDFIERELDLTTVKKGSAVYNAILCLIALQQARDFYTTRPLNTGDYINENINDHHIFPAKVEGLEPETSTTFNDTKDFILNRTLLLDETNGKIQNKLPSQYLKIILYEKLNGNEVELQKLMEAHFISSKALDYLWNDNYDAFIKEREKTIKKYIIKRLEL